MKLKIISLIFSIMVVSVSCKKDEDSDSSSGYKANYKNQVLQGKINGVDWTFISGKILQDTSFFDMSKTQYSFTFTDTMITDTCFINAYGRLQLQLEFSDKDPILAVKSHSLNNGYNEFSKSLVFVHFENNLAKFDIAYSGAFEILTVDEVNGIVTGRMDVRLNENNYVNGNFTLKYCNHF